MNEHEQRNFILKLGREPNENDERLMNCFTADGCFGRYNIRYNELSTDNANVYKLFSSYMERFPCASGTFTASDIYPYFLFSVKNMYFRPLDIIWTSDAVITDSKKTGRAFRAFVSGIYALSEKCPGITIDISKAGCTLEELGSKQFFVYPQSSKYPKLLHLKECGIVTSDTIVRIIDGENEYVLPKCNLPSMPSPKKLTYTGCEFNDGFMDAFNDILETISPNTLSSAKAKKSTPLDNDALPIYNLGYSSCASRFSSVIPASEKKELDSSSDLYLTYIKINKNDMESMSRSLKEIVSIRNECETFSAFYQQGEVEIPNRDVIKAPDFAETVDGVIIITDRELPGGTLYGFIRQ